MPKELMTMVLERDNLQQKWGLTIQGGADLALTAKIASVKVGTEPGTTGRNSGQRGQCNEQN